MSLRGSSTIYDQSYVVFQSVIMPRETVNSYIERYERYGGNIGTPKTIYGSISIITGQSSTYSTVLELARDWPEVVVISVKLVQGRELDERDKLWLSEMAEACGWSVEDVAEDLVNLAIDPSERVERYRSLFEDYYGKALKHKAEEDTRQAAEKLWGAAVALVKLYAALKGVFIAHWSHSRLYNFIESNVEREYRELFAELLDSAFLLHEYFYESHLGPELFEFRWRKTLEFIEKAREIVYRFLRD